MIFSASTKLLENNFWVDVLDPKALGIRPRPKKGLFLPKLSSVWFEVEKSSQTSFFTGIIQIGVSKKAFKQVLSTTTRPN